MNCKSCNTRLPRGGGTCPHCGHVEKVSQFIDQMPAANSEHETAPLDHDLGEEVLSDEVELPLEAAVSAEFTLEAVTETEVEVDAEL